MGAIYVSIGRRNDGHNEVQTVEFYSVLQKKDMLTYATSWINPEDHTPSEIRKKQTGKGIPALCGVPRIIPFVGGEGSRERGVG